MKKLNYFLAILTIIPIIVLTGCSKDNSSKNKNDANIKIAAQSTTESSIMANMIRELINHELGYKTTLISNLGSTNVVHQALMRKDADIAATRYTGTDLTGTLNLPAEKDNVKASKIIKKEFTKRFIQVLSTPALAVVVIFFKSDTVVRLLALANLLVTIKA